MKSVIELVELTKTYELGEVQVNALRGVNLKIERGEFVAVMGASGSGKSTLMNMLGCLDRPTSGRYILEGEDVARLNESELATIRSRRIGFVFQNFNLLSRTSTLENVELPLFYSAWTADGEHRAADLVKLVGLAGREQSHPNQLSGGQQQRVAIARALVNRPSILLADEPTGNLDSTNSAEIMDVLTKLNREQGLTVIVVTHDPDVAAYADRIVTFRDGVIISDTRKDGVGARGGASVPAAAPGMEAADRTASLLDEVRTFASMAVVAAGRAIKRNKLRAALTMLGIFIGVAAVITMVAVGDGARASVEAQINSLGTNLLIVVPGATTANGARAGLGSNSTLTIGDAQALARSGGAVALVTYMDRQVAQVVSGNRNWSTNIQGTTPSYFAIRDWPPSIGRIFTDAEEKAGAPVCLLGQTVVNNLFGEGQNPVGATIRVKNSPMKVIGVLSVKGQSSYGQDQDDVVIVPFNTAERKVLGVSAPSAAAAPAAVATASSTNPYASVPTTNSVYSSTTEASNAFGAAAKITGVVNVMFVKASGSDEVDNAVAQITRMLHERHHIQPKQDDDFTVRDLSEIAAASEGATQVMTMLLLAVASISLLVGGIGIMNIMLVSVTERTREIGIRMAVGARRIHIMLQFLVEAMLLSAMGGLAGVILGILVSKLISALAEWPTLVSPTAVMGGFIFSAAVGVFFGYYPARKASLLHPIDALRYE
ncbi:MAG: ABC transporter permease [Candidatus Binatus sp.]|jgi:macrolide transport system ATP-binding/permease protein|uniref:ABC transporter permease n=1 Tax=Candidatus Binatus sp. TaxID=2811406 RepID=UPI003D0F8F9E